MITTSKSCKWKKGNLTINGKKIERATKIKKLGIILDEQFKGNYQVEGLCQECVVPCTTFDILLIKRF